jgi:hypothetical protein
LQLGIDRLAVDVEASGDRRDRQVFVVELTDGKISRHASGMALLTLVLLPLNSVLWAAVTPPV